MWVQGALLQPPMRRLLKVAAERPEVWKNLHYILNLKPYTALMDRAYRTMLKKRCQALVFRVQGFSEEVCYRGGMPRSERR